MTVVERRPLWRGDRCGEATVVERWPLWRGDRCGEATVTARWPSWRGLNKSECVDCPPKQNKVAVIER